MSNARALSSDDIRGLRDELASGATPTVWFTSSAVGVQEGRSGKVTALDEPAEGDFIQVRPAGSKDVLSFSAGEVTVVKPARKSKAPEPSAGKSPAPGSASKAATPKAATSGPVAAKATVDAASDVSGAGRSASAGKPAPKSDEPAPPARGGTRSERSTSGAKGKPRHPAGAAVTLTAGSEGQWHVEVNNGKKRVVRPTPVPASAVASAAKELHDDVAQAVEPLLEAAREHQRDRVEQLQQELSDAQRMLDDLSG